MASAFTSGSRGAGAAAALALHALAGAALLSYQPPRDALLAVAPVMVHFVAPPAPKVEEPKPQPRIEAPKPKPVVRRPKPVEPPPVLAAPVEAPSPSPVVVAPPPPPAPAPVVAAPPAQVPVTMPVFDADYLENPAPSYPQFSRRLGEQGRVILRVLVSPRGTAEDVQVRTSSGYQRLDNSARDTVRHWKFVPAQRGSEPVAAWVLIPISFRLDS